MIIKWVSYLPQMVKNTKLTRLVGKTNKQKQTNKQNSKTIQAKLELGHLTADLQGLIYACISRQYVHLLGRYKN